MAERRSRPRSPVRAAARLDGRARRRRPSAYGVLLGSIALFLVLLALLAWQMRAGGDPALGAGTPAKLPPRPVQVVVVHRVVRKLVIVHEHRPAPAASAPPASSPSTSSGSAPAVSPAPAPAAPPPAPVPAPAPAPPPVVTRSS